MQPFHIKPLFKANWALLNGAKWAILAPLLVFALISMGIGLLFKLLSIFFGLPLLQGGFTIGFSFGDVILAFVIEVILIFATGPLIAGAQMVALKRIRGESIDAKSGFQYWHLWRKLGLTLILIALGVGLINVTFGILITLAFKVAGFWLALIFQLLALVTFILYYAFVIFALLFVIDKNDGVIETFISCYKMVRPRWLQLSKVILCLGVGLIILGLPYVLLSMSGYTLLGLLGLVLTITLAAWAIPWFHLVVSSLFHTLSRK